MVEIELTEREHQALRAALESYVRELRGEIFRTDTRGMREDLKEQEKTLERVLARLPEATPRGPA